LGARFRVPFSVSFGVSFGVPFGLVESRAEIGRKMGRRGLGWGWRRLDLVCFEIEVEAAAEIVGRPAELREALAQAAGELGELLGTEDEKRDHEYDPEFEGSNAEHGVSLAALRGIPRVKR
jgi:hypothetical protein